MSHPSSRRAFVLGASAWALAGCAGVDTAGTSGPAAEAPTFRVGDRWVYRGREGFRVGVEWEETHEVTSIGPGGITIKVTYRGDQVNGTQTETWASPGLLKTGSIFDIEMRRFDPPLPYYEFPLRPGERWGGWYPQFNVTKDKAAEINRYTTVNGWDKVSTPAGTFDALRLRVLMRLDDEEFWRFPTTCNYLLYYAPAVGAIVRAEKDAEYWEKGDRRDGVGAVRAQHTLLELVSYTRG